MKNDLHEFVFRSQSELQAEYQRIQLRAKDDPGTAGDQGEENWATLLRSWLPSYFKIVTKGRILTASGYVSPQVDVLVLYPSYPSVLVDKKLYLSGGVAAAFECKTTLTASHVRTAVKTAAALQRAQPIRHGSPYKELHTGLIYGLLAHAHSWKGNNSRPEENVTKAIWEADQKHVRHPRECLDLVTIANLSTWAAYKTVFMSPKVFGDSELHCAINGGKGYATTCYVCKDETEGIRSNFQFPVAELLSNMLSKLAWTFSDIRPLAHYFEQAKGSNSKGGPSRAWDISIYSEAIRERVSGSCLLGLDTYDEWRFDF